MTATEIESAIESEKLDIHCAAYSDTREYLEERLKDELENGDVVDFARNHMAAVRRAMLHSLQELYAPAQIIEEVLG